MKTLHTWIILSICALPSLAHSAEPELHDWVKSTDSTTAMVSMGTGASLMAGGFLGAPKLQQAIHEKEAQLGPYRNGHPLRNKKALAAEKSLNRLKSVHGIVQIAPILGAGLAIAPLIQLGIDAKPYSDQDRSEKYSRSMVKAQSHTVLNTQDPTPGQPAAGQVN